MIARHLNSPNASTLELLLSELPRSVPRLQMLSGIMGIGKWLQTVHSLESEHDLIQRRRYGVIEIRDQEFRALHLRPFPKLGSVVEARWDAIKKPWQTNRKQDRVLLYYNQPFLYPKYLALAYFVSGEKSSLASIAVSLSVLDYIAQVKQSDAIVTEVTNHRIKDRHLEHFGWERHMHNSRKRNWIKRFYGDYPESFLFQYRWESTPLEEPTLVVN